jgi:hypothetical protein
MRTLNKAKAAPSSRAHLFARTFHSASIGCSQDEAVQNCTDSYFRCIYRCSMNGEGRMAGTGSRAGPSSYHLLAVSKKK